jgi:hypothetical protein
MRAIKSASSLLSIILVATAFQIFNAPASHAAVSTLNLASTTAKPQVDPNIQVGTTLNASSWASAYGSTHPWGTTSISGGATSSTWIACDTSDGTTCLSTTRYFRYRFSMPSDYTSPSLTIKWLVDNSGSIYLNGTQIPGSSHGGGPSSVITATRTTGFQSGLNTLVFEVIDTGGLAGFAFAMQISATTNGTITSYAAGGKVSADLSFATTSYSKNFGQTQAVLATSSSSGAITYSAGSSTACSVNSSSGLVTISAGTGTCIISASVAEDANYLTTSSTNSVTITVSRIAQSAITITPATATYGSNLTLVSTGGSTGGSYNYSKVSGNCTLSGAVLTPTATGSCVVQSNLATTTNYLAETSTATTITISSGSVSASLTLAPGNLTFRQAKNITAVATVAGKITFRVAGKILPGCKNKAVNDSNSLTAICSYRPSNHSYVTISATLVPTDEFYLGSVTNSAQYLVTKRTGTR